MAKQSVFVEINPKTELPIRIVKHTWQVAKLDPEIVRRMARSVAVGYIREQVIERAKRNNLILCEFCGNVLTEVTGEMHEVVPTGDGGEVSLENCRFICNLCHTGRTGEHGDRYWGGKQDRKV